MDYDLLISTELVHFVPIVCSADWQVMCLFKKLHQKGKNDPCENLCEDEFCYFYEYCDLKWRLNDDVNDNVDCHLNKRCCECFYKCIRGEHAHACVTVCNSLLLC